MAIMAIAGTKTFASFISFFSFFFWGICSAAQSGQAEILKQQ
jgi:hypothetical protein